MGLTRWVLVAATVCTAAPAAAEPEVYLRVEAAGSGKAPQIVTTVIGGPAGTDPSRWSLVQIDRDDPVEIHATDLRAYRASDDLIAIVLLVEGHIMFIGNTTYEPDPDARFAGVFRHLVEVPGAFHTVGPPGSLGAIVTYADGGRVRAPFGPLGELSGAALGTEADYEGNVARDLVAGVEESVRLLRSVTAARKALIVIGDGADTNVDSGRTRLAAVRKQCQRDRIELYAIALSAGIGDELTAIPALVPTAELERAGSAADLLVRARVLADRIANRYELRFPGYDAGRRIGFAWDGRDHELQLRLDGRPFPPDADAMTLRFGHAPPPSRQSSSSWGLVLAGLLGVIAAAGAGFVVWRRRARQVPRASTSSLRS